MLYSADEQSTTAEVLEGIKRQWVDAGRPSDVGWMPKVTRPS